MNQNNSAPVIMLKSKPSKFISDEEIAKINEEIPFGHLAQNLKRTEEVCRANMRKMLMPYYEDLSRDIDLVHGVDPERENFLKQVQKSMKNYLDDTLSDGTDRESYFILRYFLEVKNIIGRDARLDDDIPFNRFKHLILSQDQRKAIEAILHEFL